MVQMAPPEERIRIQNSLAGDTEAFAALVQEYQKMVFAVTFRMTGSFGDAEDLTQETFLRAFRQLESFRSESKFSTWLCQIAMNLSLNWRSRESRRGQVHSTWADNVMADSGPCHYPDELSRRVQSALDKLPAKQRAAIVLTAYEGCSHAEAAKLLECSETTVSWRVFAARRRLKRLLKGVKYE